MTNLWWTGQLPEHNKEMTFLSDIDWRISTYLKDKKQVFENLDELKIDETTNLKLVNSIKPFQQVNKKTALRSPVGPRTVVDLVNCIIDFPDSEQYYNPKERRWMLSSGYHSFWFDIEMNKNNLTFGNLNNSLSNNFDLIPDKDKIKNLKFSKVDRDIMLKFLQQTYTKKNISLSATDFTAIDSPTLLSDHNSKEYKDKYFIYYNLLNKRRELIDLFTYKLLETGLIKEIFFLQHKISLNVPSC